MEQSQKNQSNDANDMERNTLITAMRNFDYPSTPKKNNNLRTEPQVLIVSNLFPIEYIDSILTDWHNKSLTTVDEVNSYLASFKENKSKPTKKESFEYTQSTFDNLDSLYDN